MGFGVTRLYKDERVLRTCALLSRGLPHPRSLAARDRGCSPERPRSFQAVPLTAAPAAHGFSLALDADRPLPQQGTAPETQLTRRARLLHTEVHAVTGFHFLHQDVWPSPGVLEVPFVGIGQNLCHLFSGVADRAVSEAAAPLLQVRAWRSSVPRGHCDLPGPLFAAPATQGAALRPRTPGTNHTVNSRYLTHGLVIRAAVSCFLTIGVTEANSLSPGEFKALVIPSCAAFGVRSVGAPRLCHLKKHPQRRQISASDNPDTSQRRTERSHGDETRTRAVCGYVWMYVCMCIFKSVKTCNINLKQVHNSLHPQK